MLRKEISDELALFKGWQEWIEVGGLLISSEGIFGGSGLGTEGIEYFDIEVNATSFTTDLMVRWVDVNKGWVVDEVFTDKGPNAA